jgi:hypothetical protein
LQSYQIYKNLAWLNELPVGEAEAVFRECCGSREWARQMAEARPFQLLENLYAAAKSIWFRLPHLERLDAYAAQSRIDDAVATTVSKELAEANRLYQEKFGFIFIVCPGGKDPNELLAICRARLGNSAETELSIAAEEQRKITEIKLNKLLER